jgi:hypothetical protein
MAPTITQNWKQKVDSRLQNISEQAAREMALANADMICRIMAGMGPDKNKPDPACGARVVLNIAAVHVPSFCEAPKDGRAYKNTYDLKTTQALTQIPPGSIIPARALVDNILTTVTGTTADQIYFGAVEVNGAGIRFYGDICFVLNGDVPKPDTVVLTSNSYDLIRPPITPSGQKPTPATLKPYVDEMAGLWRAHTAFMATLKTIGSRAVTDRRLTTGQISAAVLDDEDYLEVLKIGSFDVTNLQEARVSAADAAAEVQIGEQLRLGPCPSLAELQWRKHRRAATKALQKQGVRTRTVTTSGRVRT